MKYYKKQFYFVGTRHGTSLHPNGILGFWMGFMIIGIFLWDDVHIVPIFDGIL